MRDEILKRVKEYIIRHDMPIMGTKVIVALSGGADSVFMLDVLHRLSLSMSFEVICVHLNHMLRGEEANRDAEFCQELCNSLGIRLSIGEFDVAEYAKEKGLSIEEAGRQVRYSFFHIVKKELNAQIIATAHNKNDLAESVLLHLMRGSGIEGLRGVQPIRSDGVIRPILDIERSEIESYCQEYGLEFVTDSTNSDDSYTRNRVRQQPLPLIQTQFNPDVLNGLSNLATICGEDSEFINARVDGYKRLIQADETGIFIENGQLIILPPSIARRLIMLMAHMCGASIGFDKTTAILQLATSEKTGKELHVGGAIFWLSYDMLYASNTKTQFPQFEYPLRIGGSVKVAELNLTVNALLAFMTEFNENTEYFEIADMDSDISIRNRRDGDIITLGGGTKKLKEFFIDEKIPKHKRDAIPLLAIGNNILWIIGVRRAAVFKPKPDVKTRVLKVTVE